MKALKAEPQTYHDSKLLVGSSKKRKQEITDIITWAEAFTVYMWIFCCAHPSRWQGMTQHKLPILKTSRQFPGKALASLQHCLSEVRSCIRPGRLVSYEPRPLQFPYSFGATVPVISHIFSIPLGGL